MANLDIPQKIAYLKSLSGGTGSHKTQADITLFSASSIDIKFTSLNNKPVTYDWGDGIVEVVNSGVLTGHTYASKYSGTLKIISTESMVNEGEIEITSLNQASMKYTQEAFNFRGVNLLTEIGSTGDINNIRTGTKVYKNLGSNTTSGNIRYLPSSIQVYTNYGNNTTTGDLKYLPPNILVYDNRGNNSCFYTTNDVTLFPDLMTVFNHIPGNNGDSSGIVTSLLYNLDLSYITNTSRLITITGTNQPPGAGASTYISSLQSKGCTVITN